MKTKILTDFQSVPLKGYEKIKCEKCCVISPSMQTSSYC